MKKVIISAAVSVVAMAAASAALAQSATQDVNLTASVPKTCAVGGSATPGALSYKVTKTDGSVDTTLKSFTVTSVICNTTADVVATSNSGGVVSATTPATGFTNIIDYIGSATFGGQTSTIDTSSTATATGPEAGNKATTTAATTGSLTITVAPSTPVKPLMAATDYSDTLSVKLSPTP